MFDGSVLMYTIIAIIAVIVLIGAGRIVLQWVRRMQLRRTFGTFEGFISADTLEPDWLPGIFRYQQGKLEVLKLHSISPMPVYTFKREDLDILRISEGTEGLAAELPEDYVLVQAKYRQDEFLMGMTFDAYAGLSAWLEARQIMGFGRY
ncbi:DUF2550 family protein [Micrococcoides hystricis]|uniref:DUF2550 family protein n=1 Tax=Micrococcoides hystricis TaxID=1572761 RepID=A0ABV6PBW4_9MICC